KQYWGSELRIPTASFEEVLSDDKAAYSWLTTLRRVGIVYLKGAPAEQGQVARLSDRIGYLRLTFYGWLMPLSRAVRSLRSPLTKGVEQNAFYNIIPHHTSHVYLIIIFKQMTSGYMRISCFFKGNQQSERVSPDCWKLISVGFCLYTRIDHKALLKLNLQHKVIEVDADGQVVRINYNNATRDSVLDAPLEQIQPFYGALKAFVDLMGRPQNLVTYRMEPGDVVTFDNWRLLHGRRSYVSTRGTPRHLEGAYLDWDEVMSRLRILGKAIRGDS
uniref:Gamma-butyrobetaine hydroxylase 1 n=1 Tax=Lepisosteus oculatus TaxID=7918 RepID=W5MHE9_LEPOC